MNREAKTMKTILKSTSLILILCMLISFAGCNSERKISEQEAVGLWTSTENKYLSNYGGMCRHKLVFKEDGTYTSSLLTVSDNKLVSTEHGTWVIEDGVLVVEIKQLTTTNFPYTSTITYAYDGKNLANGVWTFEKQDYESSDDSDNSGGSTSGGSTKPSITREQAISYAKNDLNVQDKIVKLYGLKFYYRPEWGTITATKDRNGNWDVVLQGTISGYTDDYKTEFLYKKKFEVDVTVYSSGYVSSGWVSKG